jgi:hypothetical protein
LKDHQPAKDNRAAPPQVRVIEAPPSTSDAVPVTKLASSEAR